MKRIGEDQGAEAASARSELFASRSTERLDFVTKSFFGFLRAGLPLGQKPVVRRPTREEIALLWSTIPFDLEDPLFVVEIGGAQPDRRRVPEDQDGPLDRRSGGRIVRARQGDRSPAAPRYVARR
jgi:hypothetical protein